MDNSPGRVQLFSPAGLELEVSVRFLPKPEAEGGGGGEEACQYKYSSGGGRRGTLTSPTHTLPANTTCSYEFQAEILQPTSGILLSTNTHGTVRLTHRKNL